MYFYYLRGDVEYWRGTFNATMCIKFYTWVDYHTCILFRNVLVLTVAVGFEHRSKRKMLLYFGWMGLFTQQIKKWKNFITCFDICLYAYNVRIKKYVCSIESIRYSHFSLPFIFVKSPSDREKLPPLNTLNRSQMTQSGHI